MWGPYEWISQHFSPKCIAGFDKNDTGRYYRDGLNSKLALSRSLSRHWVQGEANRVIQRPQKPKAVICIFAIGSAKLKKPTMGETNKGNEPKSEEILAIEVF